MPKLDLDVLPAPQRRLWDQFQEQATFLNQEGYYLAGGSALALQIGHRQSVDFDFFSRKLALGEITQEWLQRFTGFIARDVSLDTLHAEVSGVKVSFISAYKYPTVEALESGERIQMAGLTDLALMKLLALTHRATLRDYIDLAALLRGPLDLKKILEAGKRKYGKRFNAMVFLRALVTFEDIDPEMPVLIDRTLETSWQKILRESVKKITA